MRAETLALLTITPGQVSLEGKEEKLAGKLTGVVEVPLVALKNTAYTNGYWANMNNKPVSNFIVKRFG